MEIVFDGRAVWGEGLQVSFFAEVDGRPVQCAITLEALDDDFRSTPANRLETFRANQAQIEAIAERLRQPSPVPSTVKAIST